MQNSCRGIKIFAVALMAFVLTLICGCNPEYVHPKVNVTIVDSVFFTAETPSGAIESGEDFSTVLDIRSGYKVAECSYANYKIDESEGVVRLTLPKITRPSRVIVKCEKIAETSPEINLNCTIRYEFNGGSTSGTETFFVEEILTHHLRPNTWNGSGLKKSGFTLYGWNTKADGSGERIGLGSRVTVQHGEKITLYAEWIKQIDGSQILYRAIAPGICAVTGYRGEGDIEPFVIPDKINGLEVVEIASSFTTNMPCGKLTADTLVLPNTVKNVKSNSFLNSSFKEICFSDNIETIEENAFLYNFKTYRINAVRRPCFQDKNNSTLFADNFDRLILNADMRKLIFFSGCSFAYGVNSNVVNDAFGDKYTVFNMGMNGDINGAFQMEILLNYIVEGDVFIHAPEQMSPAQLMYSFYTNSTMFVMTEGNYDLLSLADFSDNGGFLRAFSDYLELKNQTDECSYSDCRYGEFNIYGDYIESRPYDEQTENDRDITYSDNNYCYAPELLSEAGIAKLTGYYDVISANGGKVYVSYAPVNISARSGTEIYDKGIEFAQKIESMLSVYGYSSISKVEDYMFKGRYFFDSDYHLNDLGAALRTEQLISDLKNAGV